MFKGVGNIKGVVEKVKIGDGGVFEGTVLVGGGEAVPVEVFDEFVAGGIGGDVVHVLVVGGFDFDDGGGALGVVEGGVTPITF